MAFIGIDRGIEEHWIYQDAEYFKVWFEILLRARYSKESEKKLIEGRLVTIEFGQFIFGRLSWSDRLHVSEKRLRKLFEKLIQDGMIQLIEKHPRFTIYNVVNFAKYRPNLGNQEGQQEGQQENLIQQAFEGLEGQQKGDERASEGPAKGQQGATQEQSSNKDNKVNKDIKKKNTRLKSGEYDPDKTSYSDFVWLKPEEYEKLVDQHGLEATKEMIEILNSYKASTGKQYPSDYHTMVGRGWVLDKYKEEQAKKFKVYNGGVQQKQNAFSRLQQLAREENEREASGNY